MITSTYLLHTTDRLPESILRKTPLLGGDPGVGEEKNTAKKIRGTFVRDTKKAGGLKKGKETLSLPNRKCLTLGYRKEIWNTKSGFNR